jgi:lipopolysaccharide export system protein LptC
VLQLQAAAGKYDTKIDALMLQNDIVLTSSTGYAAKLNEALFDIKKNTIVSERPVEVTLSNGTVNANRLEVMDNGELIRFDKGVEMNLVPQAARETTASVPDAPRKGQ